MNCVKLEEHKTCWGSVSQSVPFLLSPFSLHRSYHLSLVSSSQLFFPMSILTHSCFPFNENDSDNKWRPFFFFFCSFISSSSQPDFKEESPGLISFMSSLAINSLAYFSLVLFPYFTKLSPSSQDIRAAMSDEHPVLTSQVTSYKYFVQSHVRLYCALPSRNLDS